MSSWASIVDSSTTTSGSTSLSSSKEIHNVECKAEKGSDTRKKHSAGKHKDRSSHPGRGAGVSRPRDRKAREDWKKKSFGAQEKPGETPRNASRIKSKEKDDCKPAKAKTVFAAPPPNAWQAAADTKERIYGNLIPSYTQEEINSATVEDECIELEAAALSQKLNISDVGVSKIDDDDESSRASLLLLSRNSYQDIVEDQGGCLYVACPKGIRNPGNVCFANSVIQALLGAAPFCQVLYHMGVANSALDIHAYPVLKALSDIAKEVQFFDCNEKRIDSRTKSMATINVKLVVALIHESFKTRYNGDQKKRQVEQEDAHEFLHCLLDALHQEFLRLQTDLCTSSKEEEIPVDRSDGNDNDEWLTQTGKRAVKQQIVTTEIVAKKSTIITQLFEGMQSTCISSRGNPPSVTMHPFLVVEIPLYDSSVETLEGAIDALTAPETISGYRPRGQHHTCDASKAERFNSLPTLLAFHLMRFQFTGSTEKLKRQIKYDGTLKIKPSWLASNSKDRHAEYELVSTISHHGQSIARGHFTANVKHEGKWLHCNDEIIHGVTLQRVFQDEPYMLLYVRKM